MIIVAINSFPYGSTGRIMLDVLNKANELSDIEVRAFYGAWKKENKPQEKYAEKFGFKFENYLSAVLSRITGFHNIGSFFGTIELLKKINTIKPDIIHLHNLHLWYINLPLLFKYIKKHNIRVVWTLHDCWAFTGQCPHFTMVNCQKWKNGCHCCSQYKDYPGALIDQTKLMWKLKKKWFNGITDMTIVTPSQWLADLVSHSFLKNYHVEVVNNGIDLNIFKPSKSEFVNEYCIGDKYIVLGVAFGWGKRKGLDIFIELAKKLGDSFQIVLVGTDEVVDKDLPSNIISIYRTNNKIELAEIYTSATVFVNTTREENFPTVNIEAIACGTPVITFATGGSPEIIDDTCGSVVECDDIDSLQKEIIRVCNENPYKKDDCIQRAKLFNGKKRFEEYISIYKGGK